MTDAEVLAKVRQDADRLLRSHILYANNTDTHARLCQTARVALAMVEQWEKSQADAATCQSAADNHLAYTTGLYGGMAPSPYADRYRSIADTHRGHASRILSALRAAVGEVQS